MLAWNVGLQTDKLMAIYNKASIKSTPCNGVFEKLIITNSSKNSLHFGI
jgi:hypothetical protein